MMSPVSGKLVNISGVTSSSVSLEIRRSGRAIQNVTRNASYTRRRKAWGNLRRAGSCALSRCPTTVIRASGVMKATNMAEILPDSVKR
jgi:hypothetical protein